MTEKDFSLRLAKLREEKGVSARDMSLSMGQNPGYINNIESGKSMPKWYADLWNLPKEERAKERSKTFPGIAKAMAERWG